MDGGTLRGGTSDVDCQHPGRLPVSDAALTTIHHALRGLWMRQQALADNMANVQTPGYRASRVDFEASLAREFATAGTSDVTFTRTQTTDPGRGDGNNVNLDDETVAMVETNLRYQTMVEAMNAKYGLLRTAIKG
jgi:flagellar basal-body rod protein FlgB